MSDMPFTSKPTMLMGIDIFQKVTPRSKKYVTGLVATIDRHLAKYHSEVVFNNDIL